MSIALIVLTVAAVIAMILFALDKAAATQIRACDRESWLREREANQHWRGKH